MMFPGVTGTAGRTPLVEFGRLAAVVPGRVVAKLEMRNPCGSVKTGSVLRWPKTPNAVAS